MVGTYRRRGRFEKYLRRTWKNKAIALGMLAISLLLIAIENDATFLAFTLIFGIPLFFARDNIMG